MNELEDLKRIRNNCLRVESAYWDLLGTFNRIHDQLVELSKEASELCNALLGILIEVDRRIAERAKDELEKFNEKEAGR